MSREASKLGLQVAGLVIVALKNQVLSLEPTVEGEKRLSEVVFYPPPECLHTHTCTHSQTQQINIIVGASYSSTHL